MSSVTTYSHYGIIHMQTPCQNGKKEDESFYHLANQRDGMIHSESEEAT